MASIERVTLPGYGLEEYILEAHDQVLKILPQKGGNAWYYQAQGHQWLVRPHNLNGTGANPGVTYGIPILFPSPNRVPEGEYVWEGQRYRMQKNGTPYWIHGLLSDEALRVGEPVSTAHETQLPLYLDITPETPWFEGYPFPCRLEVIWTLDRRGLLFSYILHNHGDRPMPFGIGLHPFFGLVSDPRDIYIQVPAERYMPTDEEFIPTGELMPVEGTPRDLREYKSIAELELNDVYWGMRPDLSAQIEYRALGRRMTLTASESFGHLVVFTPRSRFLFCVENQSCSTNALNLYARGQREVSGLQVLAPGASCGGWVRFEVNGMD